MSTFNPLPSYLLGGLVCVLGLNVVLRPVEEYHRFGLPREHATTTTTANGKSSKGNSPSPFVYLKGVREMTYGLALLGLQLAGQETAVTIFAGILSLVALSDGVVVWIYGAQLRRKAFGHWATSLAFALWSWWRASR